MNLIGESLIKSEIPQEDALSEIAYAYSVAIATLGKSDSSPVESFSGRFPLAREMIVNLTLMRARVLYSQGKYEEADSIVDAAFDKHSRSPLLPDLLYKKATALLLRKRYDDAKETLLNVYSLCEEQGDLLYDVCFKLGATYYFLGDFDSSAFYFEVAAGSPKAGLRQDAIFNRGLALEDGGHLIRASHTFHSYATRYPLCDRFERALVRSAYTLEKAGRFEDAIRIYRSVARYSDSDQTKAEAYYWIGECLSQLGRHLDSAVAFLRVGFEFPGESAWAGTARYRAGLESEKCDLRHAARKIYEENVKLYGRSSPWGQASYERLLEIGE